MSKFEYDIALSFAGEDRGVVEKIASLLKDNNIKVFYDNFERARLWGEDLYELLAKLYSKQAQFCLMFISSSYVEKLWTNHERQNAQERAFQERGVYILPVRLDDTEVPGVRNTIGYIDLRQETPEQLVKLVKEKLELNFTEIKQPNQKVKIPLYNKSIIDASSNEPFFNFIEKNFGKMVHLNIEINGDDPFIEVNLDSEPYFAIACQDDKECIETARAENKPILISCGGTEYNLTGEGYDFYWNRLSYILSGYFIVPENGGQVHQGIYSIVLEAIPRKEILFRNLE